LSGGTKLSDEQVAEIRRLYATEDVSTGNLAVRFGVTASYVYYVVKGLVRQDAPGLTPELREKVHERRRDKLTDADVKRIRELWNDTDMTLAEIGKQFGVTDANISMIVSRKRRT
jgi:DNA-binding MarR family transcriptional regulator